MKRCYIFTMLISVVAVSVTAAQPVNFPDANLKAAVEEALGEANPTQTEMRGLTSFNAGGKDITDLTGLEYATNLTSLYLGGNQISDITALSNLTNLTHLDIGANQIADVSALSGMLQLQRLFSGYNQITDISAISNMTKLVNLHLQSNHIDDISSLSELTGLIELNTGSNQISDISALSGMLQLQRLFSGYNQITDISAISNMTQLVTLHLQDNSITDIGPLSDLSNLQKLWLSNNQISDISSLSGLGNLEELLLSINQISDISSLSGLGNLKKLWLYSNQIVDISLLGGLNNLQELHLSYNKINDFTYLRGLDNLHTLFLSGTQLDDIDPLSSLVNLQTLWLHSNNISDISALSPCTQLKFLELRNNRIADLDALLTFTHLEDLRLDGNPLAPFVCTDQLPQIEANNSGIKITGAVCSPYVVFADPNLKACVELALGVENPTQLDMLELTNLYAQNLGIVDLTGLEYALNLTHLNLGDNKLSDISILADLTNLEVLHIKRNSINNITPLLGLLKLQTLRLNQNHISDISPLADLENLNVLSLDGNPVSDISALAGLTNLEDLSLIRNPINDINPLAGLLKLWRLTLARNQIYDISPLANLTNLESLCIEQNQISDLSPLAGLSHLEGLFLRFNLINDLSPLLGLTNLEYLYLLGNPLDPNVCSEQIPQIKINNPGILIEGADCSQQVAIVPSYVVGNLEEPIESETVAMTLSLPKTGILKGAYGVFGTTSVIGLVDPNSDPRAIPQELSNLKAHLVIHIAEGTSQEFPLLSDVKVPEVSISTEQMEIVIGGLITYRLECSWTPLRLPAGDYIVTIVFESSGEPYGWVGTSICSASELVNEPTPTGYLVTDPNDTTSCNQVQLLGYFEGEEILLRDTLGERDDDMDPDTMPDHCQLPGSLEGQPAYIATSWAGSLGGSVTGLQLDVEEITALSRLATFSLLTRGEGGWYLAIHHSVDGLTAEESFYNDRFQGNYLNASISEVISQFVPPNCPEKDLEYEFSYIIVRTEEVLEPGHYVLCLYSDTVAMFLFSQNDLGSDLYNGYYGKSDWAVVMAKQGISAPSTTVAIDIWGTIVPDPNTLDFEPSDAWADCGCDKSNDWCWGADKNQDGCVDANDLVAEVIPFEGFEIDGFNMFDWASSGDAEWVISTEAQSGSYCAQAGSIGDDDISTLSVTLDCVEGDITFYRKVSSESNFDYLKFYIDGAEQDKWSGDQDWIEVSFPVEAGARTFEWTYSKDGSASRGEDTAWIDDIVFPCN